LRRAGHERGRRRRDRGQRRVFNRDQIRGVERLSVRLGDDQRDRLADEAHRVGGQQRLRCEGERLAGLDVGLDRRSRMPSREICRAIAK
jgi:hypothetical protein